MITVTVAGNAGKDAEARTTQSGDSFCAFSIAGTAGFGDNQQTVWFDVTKWGKGADSLAKHILKGTPLAVTGELSQREHDGKTYLQIRADRIKLQGSRPTGQQSSGERRGAPADDGSDYVPF